jgi:hypothetical protein
MKPPVDVVKGEEGGMNSEGAKTLKRREGSIWAKMLPPGP